MTEVAWRPTSEYIENANVTRLMRAHGIASIDELRRRSVEDMEWFWDAVVQDLGIEFFRPYTQVADTSRGIVEPADLTQPCLPTRTNGQSHPCDALESGARVTRASAPSGP